MLIVLNRSAETARRTIGTAEIIEAAMNELSPILIRNGIIVTSEYHDIVVTERFKGDPKDGKAMRFCTLRGGFRFMAADGSQVTSECYGEAMDSGDQRE